MIIFKTLTLKNFLSYGNVDTVIDLTNIGTTLIVGENLDDTTNGAGGNGVGKTTILNALTYALWDKPISNISKDNLINNINKKNMCVKLDFSIKDCQYSITRVRGEKAGQSGNYVKLTRDGADITPDSITNTNELIEKILNINYDIFTYMIAFSASKTPFLDLPARAASSTNQNDIIERLFALTTLSDNAAALKIQIKETDQRLTLHKVKIEHAEKEHSRHNDLIESSKRRMVSWEQQTENSIADAKQKLNKITNVDIQKEQELHSDMQVYKDKLSVANNNLTKVQSELRTLTSQVPKHEKDLSHLNDAKCPFCLQHYENADKITECTNKLHELQSSILKLTKTQTKIQAEIKTLTEAYNELKSETTVSNIKELLDIYNQSNNLKQKVIDLEQAENPHLEAYTELVDTVLEPIDYSQINELTTLINHQNFLLKLLTKKDSFVRKALLNKNLPYLNNQLNHYLKILGLPHKVEFTHELKAEISQFDRYMDFGNLSAGQQARVNIALSFSFRDVLEKMHNKINIYMLDEIIDIGLDLQGVQAVTKMLKQKAKEEHIGIWVISHRNEVDSVFNRTMVVRMQNGFSSAHILKS